MKLLKNNGAIPMSASFTSMVVFMHLALTSNFKGITAFGLAFVLCVNSWFFFHCLIETFGNKRDE
jgi:hypothetical protein